MSKRVISVLVLLVVVAFSCKESTKEEQVIKKIKKPSFLLIMADDLGWGDPGFNNGPGITPGLDSMAANGLVFNRFYASGPVCSPTRASFMTGWHHMRMGVESANVGSLSDDAITIGEYLKTKGYKTGHFGKWHLGTLTKTELDGNRGGRKKHEKHFKLPADHGFDEAFVTESKVPTWNPMEKPKSMKGKVDPYWFPIENKDSAEYFGTAYWDANGIKDTSDLSGNDDKLIVDRAIDFMERSVEEEKPFGAVVWFHTPHIPYVTEKQYRDKYDGDDNHKSYYGSVTAMDEQLARLRTKVKELGISEHTMILFCSDNGAEVTKGNGSTGGLRGEKRDVYEGGIRVPGIIEWGSHLAGKGRTNFPMSTSDILPTIMDILKDGKHLPEKIDGISIYDHLQGMDNVREAPIGFWYYNKRAMLNERFKIVSYDAGQSFEMYDLGQDPQESIDVKEQFPEEYKSLIKQWGDFYASVNADFESLEK